MNFNKEIIDKKIVVLSPLEPFTWASGIQSPIYCDNRLILGFPEFRTFVIEQFVDLINKDYSDVEVIMGTSTAGIPHGTLVADKMQLPCGYVRSGAKAHGKGNQIEGCEVSGKKVVVVEDLISTGGSVIEVVDALKAAGAIVLGVVAIFSYELKRGQDNFKEHNIKYSTISDINQLLTSMQETGAMSVEEITLVKKFLSNPNDWQ